MPVLFDWAYNFFAGSTSRDVDKLVGDFGHCSDSFGGIFIDGTAV